MFSINLRSRTAIYEQIIGQIEDSILKGILKSGEQLPSVRGLSTELTLNPNTVSRAYSDLEKRGIIYSLVGKGSFIAPEAVGIIKEKYINDFSDFKEALIKYRSSGVEKETLILLINSIYALEENNND